MNLVKRTPGRVYPNAMDNLFKDLLGGTQYAAPKALPPVNIVETEEAYIVELVAPGLEKENFNIEIDNDLLTIASKITTENDEQAESKFTRREFVFSSFKRSFTLPETVKEDEINASYTNGILKLMLPKKEEALPKAKRLVAIS